jgi:hypothetical protein
MSRKLRFPAHADIDRKQNIAFNLALLSSEHLINNKGNFEDVYYALRRYMQEHRDYIEEVDADIEEWNKKMEFVHRILATALKNERKGRIKPDCLSEEERDVVIRLGIKKEMKDAEIVYWSRIGILMTVGLTREQAREKIYQDLVDKGDLKGAKVLRDFQDKIDPVKADDHLPPSSTPPMP